MLLLLLYLNHVAQDEEAIAVRKLEQQKSRKLRRGVNDPNKCARVGMRIFDKRL